MKPRVLICIFLYWAAVTMTKAQLPEGLYAEMQTTHGDFTFELFYQEAPRTVANFISLAEGSRVYHDLPRGRPSSDPFYISNHFHRVISNFVIQAGSPFNNGLGGPGYRFSDEFSPGLTHNTTGIVSMANSGPDSNGSQFFITLAPTPWLDNLHSVFGKIVQGLTNVLEMGSVAVDTNNVPLVDVVITNVTIHRVGSMANAFDPNSVTPALPLVSGVTNTLIYRLPGVGTVIDWPNDPSSRFILSANLFLENEGWETIHSYTGIDAGGYIIDGFIQQLNRLFFTVTKVQYSESF